MQRHALMQGRWLRVTLTVSLLAAVVVGFASWTDRADAATYSASCPGGDAACAALAERLEVAVAELEAANATLTAIDGNTAGTGEISGTVALSPDDKERLDLAWWGAWAMVGLLLVVIIAQRWYGSWRVLRE